MKLRTSKDPRGSPMLVFLAGLGLELVVGLVAFRALAVDALTEIAGGRSDSPVTSAESSVPDKIVPLSDEPPASLATIGTQLGDSIEATRPICWANLAEAADHGRAITLQVTIEADGSVSSAHAPDASAPLGACLEAEASTWTFDAPGSPVMISRSVRFE